MVFDDAKSEHAGGSGKTKGRGRKDQQSQEAVISVEALKKWMPKAIKWEKEDMDRASDKSEFYKKGGELTGLNVAQLKTAAKAYAKEAVEEAKRKAEQLTLILDECGQ